MDFENKMNEFATGDNPGSVEIPNEARDSKDETVETEESEDVKQNAETKDAPTLNEMVESGEIHKSWTKINVSKWCGCNNACFHACTNIG